ncbi:MAG: hypothetical protein N4A57_06135 [Anaeromicrobium sp.]|jgi:hypothetical protein|nr:hypothetical protein [Anaeromicrobium sp.]
MKKGNLSVAKSILNNNIIILQRNKNLVWDFSQVIQSEKLRKL